MLPKQNEKYGSFEDENDFGKAKIDINVKGPENNQVSSSAHAAGGSALNSNPFMKNVFAKKEDALVGMIAGDTSKKTEEMSNAVMDKINTNLGFIGKYFNVEVDDIKDKLISALIPGNRGFHALAEKNPDLYGPFWILTTLIFLVCVAANMSNYIKSENKDNYQYDFTMIPNAALFLYGLGFGIPIILFLLMKFLFKVDVPLIMNVCIYGYSFTSLAPVCLICVIPPEIVETIALAYYTAHSCFFLIYNMWNFLVEKAPNAKWVILILLAIIQGLIFLFLKFYFFKEMSHSSSATAAAKQ